MDIKRALGQRVKSLRETKGLSQQQLAERLDMSVDAISMIERGRNWPSAKTLTAIADLFEMSATTVLSRMDPNDQSPASIYEAHQLLDELALEDVPVAVALLSALRARL